MPPEDEARPIPAAEQLQFRRAEPIGAATPTAEVRRCVACQQVIPGQYFHAQGQVVCPSCAARIQAGQQAPPRLSLVRAALYGGAAALAGSVLYALVSIALHLQIGWIAFVIGIMVGKAIRYASNGMGGRPQQILAVALTYFAITTSYVPVFLYYAAKSRTHAAAVQDAAPSSAAGSQAKGISATPPIRPNRMSLGRALGVIFAVATVAPFLMLFRNPVSGLLSLFIIFIGLQRAWALTGRSDILVLGPYHGSDAASV
jgi:hypothetical protein